MSDSIRPHRRQPTRLPCPWDSPSKNTGVGCHFLLQCMKVKSESEVAQSCLTHSDPMDYSPPGSSIHGVFQARMLEWGAVAFSDLHTQGFAIPLPGIHQTETCFLKEVYKNVCSSTVLRASSWKRSKHQSIVERTKRSIQTAMRMKLLLYAMGWR